jgi:hypothetical protein
MRPTMLCKYLSVCVLLCSVLVQVIDSVNISSCPTYVGGTCSYTFDSVFELV